MTTDQLNAELQHYMSIISEDENLMKRLCIVSGFFLTAINSFLIIEQQSVIGRN